MSTPKATQYRVEACNISHASENKIHDDTVAQKLGFSGGLVPGVEVYAYACHPVVERWGAEWLTRGALDCRFLKPVYDGRTATATATETESGLDLTVESEGTLCTTGQAILSHGNEAPRIDSYEARALPLERPPASETSLAVGTPLGIAPYTLTRDMATDYMTKIRETDELYAREGIAHPGLLLRLCNTVLRENVRLAPWVHTGSKVQNFALGRIGDTFTARARVSANYERKGHRLVDLDVILVANGRAVVAHVLHTAVYQLRHLNAGA